MSLPTLEIRPDDWVLAIKNAQDSPASEQLAWLTTVSQDIGLRLGPTIMQFDVSSLQLLADELTHSEGLRDELRGIDDELSSGHSDRRRWDQKPSKMAEMLVCIELLHYWSSELLARFMEKVIYAASTTALVQSISREGQPIPSPPEQRAMADTVCAATVTDRFIDGEQSGQVSSIRKALSKLSDWFANSLFAHDFETPQRILDTIYEAIRRRPAPSIFSRTLTELLESLLGSAESSVENLARPTLFTFGLMANYRLQEMRENSNDKIVETLSPESVTSATSTESDPAHLTPTPQQMLLTLWRHSLIEPGLPMAQDEVQLESIGSIRFAPSQLAKDNNLDAFVTSWLCEIETDSSQPSVGTPPPATMIAGDIGMQNSLAGQFGHIDIEEKIEHLKTSGGSPEETDRLIRLLDTIGVSRVTEKQPDGDKSHQSD